MMRVLQVMAGKGLGGAETYGTDIMLSLHAAGVDQCVVVAKDAPRFAELKAAGLRLRPDILSPRIGFVVRWKMARLIALEQPDLIHCWMRRAASFMPRTKGWASFMPRTKGWASFMLCTKRWASFMLCLKEQASFMACFSKLGFFRACSSNAASSAPEIQEGAAKRRPVIGWFGGYYDPSKFEACTHFVGVTRDIVAHMVKKGVAASRAFYVPTFPDVKEEPPVDRATLATPPEAKVVLALSRLHQKKGLDTLIRAAVGLPEVVLWLAGEGPLRGELEKLVRDVGMEQRVRFLGWRTDRGALLRAADICCLPSRYEPFGTVILEAWAAHTPFVACRSAGPAAHVEDGENGLLVAIDDVEALREALRRVMQDEPLRRHMIEKGYKTYAQSYTREAVTAQMIALYKDLISGKAA